MIVLKRLRVNALKHLRAIDLCFPRRGSVLIEGPNEAGKSTLFEAIYFALYGRALVGEDRPTLSALLPHDRSQASVSLTLVCGESELEVTRSLTRGRTGAIGSEASLIVRRPGASVERIHAVSAVNERIEQELRGIDCDTFRNSLFMEQKALERIEVLPRESRDKAISRLLGLERLALAERLVAPPAALLEKADTLRERLGIALRRTEARVAGARVSEADQRLRAAELYAAIAQRDELASRLTTFTQREETLRGEREEIQARIQWIDGVSALERRLVAAESLRWSAINTQREADRLAARLNDLASSERLPEAQRRLAEISALEERLALAQERLRQLTQSAEAAQRIAIAEEAVSQAQQAAAVAERELGVARQALASQRLGEMLVGWLRAHEALDLQSKGGQRLAALQADHNRQIGEVASARADSRRWLIAAGASGAVSLFMGTVALAAHAGIFWAFALLALLAAGAVGLRWRRQMTDLRTREWRASEIERQMAALSAEINLSLRLGGSSLAQYEAGLRAANAAVPSNTTEARERLATLPSPEGIEALEARLRAAETTAALTRFNEERAAAELEQARVEWERLQAQAGIAYPTPVTADQLQAAERELAEIAEEAQRLGAPGDLAGLAAARGAAEATVASLSSAVEDYTQVTARLDDHRAQVTSARDEWVAALAAITADARAAGLDAPPVPAPGADIPELEAQQESLTALFAERASPEEGAALRAREGAIGAELDQLATASNEARSEHARLVAAISVALADEGATAQGDEPLAELATRWPQLAEAVALDAAEIERLRAERERADREAYHAAQTSEERAREARIEGDELDGEALRAELEAVEREIRQRELAARLAAETRARIIRRALPETEAYMRAILPALTQGRYRDVSLTRDDAPATQGGGVDLAIRMWDDVAGRYVRKNLFSGGARDQASLALRLAFALATLPRGRGATPGFIFLDEPLSAFDAERSRALARALTHGAIADAFPQVFLISHSQVIDPRDFDYTLRMEDGRLVESTLPTGEVAASLWEAEEGVRIAATEN
jgi:DNA repair exonuclease SbcCD ATPase subunit